MVDPGRWWRMVAEGNLSALGGQVTCVRSAAEALRRADGDRPARILVLPMPPGQAMAIRNRLKQHPPAAHIPVLMPADQLAFLRCLVALGREARSA